MTASHKVVEQLRQYKLERGCLDCGYKIHHAALEFDHREGESKIADVAVLLNQNRLTAMWEEIAKCDVVCKNCHGIRTWNRTQQKKDNGQFKSNANRNQAIRKALCAAKERGVKLGRPYSDSGRNFLVPSARKQRLCHADAGKDSEGP
jgi:hypothetical protein